MKKTVHFGNSVIRYSVTKSKRRKTSEIIVDKSGVHIRAPQSKPTSEIERIVEQKKKWIFKKQLEFKDKTSEKIKTKSYTKASLKRKVNYYASKLGVSPRKIVIKKLKSRWGSATKDNVINLNESLLKAPKNVIEYVILHELCHLKIRNHSYKFWKLVNRFMPKYEDPKKWLEVNNQIIV